MMEVDDVEASLKDDWGDDNNTEQPQLPVCVEDDDSDRDPHLPVVVEVRHFGRNELASLKEKSESSNPEEAKWLLNLFLNYTDNERFHCEFLEYLPNIALIFSGNINSNLLNPLVSSHLLPLLVKSLNDTNTKVVKSGESAFLSLLENNLISNEFIETQVWPVLEEKINFVPSIASACSAIMLMSKMAPWLRSEMTERLLLPSLLQLSSSSDTAIRNVCATHYGDFCAVVSTETTESILVPKFISLCEDKDWLVRKSCVESFTSVSCMVNMETRKHKLARTFGNLLKDENLWVRVAALLSLGPFIITFAEPKIVKLGYNHVGDLVLKHPDGFEYKLNSNKVDESLFMQQSTSLLSVSSILGDEPNYNFEEDEEDKRFDELLDNSFRTDKKEDDETKFNQFQYWRDPLPDIDNDLNNVSLDNNNRECFLEDKFSNSVSIYEENDDLVEIVPRDLVLQFVSMSERPVGIDLAQHCAYSLSAVALTLGRQNWNLIKPACDLLAVYDQWKVRKIIASSLHELADLVGEEVATRDLVPIFKGFIKDLDEVRIGALKHLAKFLKLLKPYGRKALLPKLSDFLVTDYKWNWRFRQELAEQLLEVLGSGIFSPADTCRHLSPISMKLLLDQVAEVRQMALHLVTELVSHVSIDVTRLRSVLAELSQQFAHSPKWNRRQTFAQFCSRLMEVNVLSCEMFARDLLPHLLDLSWDRVPNVRLSVAKALCNDIMPHAYFSDPTNAHCETITAVIKRLQGDKDRDVRFFATPAVTTNLADSTFSLGVRSDEDDDIETDESESGDKTDEQWVN